MAVLIFIFGLLVGSFLNVCIWRLPEDEQVIRGRSHCRHCKHMIPWYDNIPLFSFIRLRGKCRFCRAPISWQYPLVELVTGLYFAAVLWRFGISVLTPIYILLGSALIVITVIDARMMIIPTEIAGPGIVVGLILSFIFPQLQAASSHGEGLKYSFLGVVVGAGIIKGMSVIGKMVFRKKLKEIGEEEAMGEGDVWLMAMIGSFLGPINVLLVAFFLAPLLGSVIGTIIRLRSKQDLIPYGPMLAAGTWVVVFWGGSLLQWYQSLLRGY